MNQFMTETNQGFVVLNAETYRLHYDGSEERVVLAYKCGKNPQYVTWESTRSGAKLDYYWGHYFSDENAALRDYHQRLIDHYL